MTAGVVLETQDGSARVDRTLVERLRRLRPILSIAVLSRLNAAEPAARAGRDDTGAIE